LHYGIHWIFCEINPYSNQQYYCRILNTSTKPTSDLIDRTSSLIILVKFLYSIDYSFFYI
jgi:hypothetical protein